MKRKLRALLPANNPRGQSLVELAISLTVMLLLLAGAVTFGMALFSYVAIRDAAQEGALYGSMYPYIDGSGGQPLNGKYDAGEAVNVNVGTCVVGAGTNRIGERVKAASNSPVNMSGFGCTNDGAPSHPGNNIDVIATTGNPCEGVTGSTPNGVQVRVEYNFPVAMPFVNAIVGNRIHLNAVVTDTILEPRCSP